jgi:hypothetical protein
MTSIHFTNLITNELCPLCHREFYENDNAYTPKETHNTILTSYLCNQKCFDYSIDNYSFLKNYNLKKVKVTHKLSYYSNMLKFLSCNIYYPKIIIYDCSLNNFKILEYIHNIQSKKEQTYWEKSFIHNCLRYNLLKIEKII